MEEEAVRVLKKSPLWNPAYYKSDRNKKFVSKKIRSYGIQLFKFNAR